GSSPVERRPPELNYFTAIGRNLEFSPFLNFGSPPMAFFRSVHSNFHFNNRRPATAGGFRHAVCFQTVI
ncbi:MAG: hypothetical protein O7G32_12950, partial [SAR324 cluster bacterium]|nr:hypothetical protein [SAR324 cluster bacterium]